MKTIREGTIGKLRLRLVQLGNKYAGVILAADGRKALQLEGTDPDSVWRRLEAEVGKLDPNYFGYDGAQNRFLRFFPGGFTSEHYAGKERNYKCRARTNLEQSIPLNGGTIASGLGEAALRIFQETNLLSPFEKIRVAEVLRSPSADDFVRAAAQFAVGDFRAALSELEHVLKPFDSAKWTVVTYLPYLWRPDSHMFLKPEVTKDFARRVGHPFQYDSRLIPEVYESLLAMTAETEREIALLKPADRIDVQSFIWVVGSYQDGRDDPPDGSR